MTKRKKSLHTDKPEPDLAAALERIKNLEHQLALERAASKDMIERTAGLDGQLEIANEQARESETNYLMERDKAQAAEVVLASLRKATERMGGAIERMQPATTPAADAALAEWRKWRKENPKGSPISGPRMPQDAPQSQKRIQGA